MQKFVRSGGAFLLMGLFFLGAGLTSRHGTFLTSVGALCLVMAIIARLTNARKPPSVGGS